ncbi:hypothetical protein AVE30378_04655 [Achromobacter veterisilvae]|uniref:NAD-specific glutamate dehydrogenase n=1 Tax=Achromobacter veterisilvae TaxID=2069367 RepID=A0A446CUS5_9BURK|nr:hypothetical protein AVE30378_04655 [Achromobacter veterisilvae]
MRHFHRVLRQGLVVEFLGGVRIQAQVELVVPAEFEARLGQGVVADRRAGMALGQVGRVRRDLVGDDAVLHILLVRQPQVFLGRDITEHGGAVPADQRGADAGGDVVVARSDVGGQRAQRVERRLVAVLQLQFHVLLDHLHRHVAGAFDHDLHVVLPCHLGQFAQRLQFRELRFVVGVVARPRTQAVAQREADVVGLHDFADFFEALVQEALLVVRQAPLRHDRTAARDDAGHAVRGHRDERQAHARVDGEVVHALLGLLDQGVAEDLPGQVLGLAVHLFQRLVDRHRADRHGRIADDPFAGFVDVLAGGQVHDRVAAPADRPRHLLDFLADAGADRGIADVGVDLHQEVAADGHRLDFRVVDIRRDDGAAARDLVAHELGRDGSRNGGAEGLARVLAQQALDHLLAVGAAGAQRFQVLFAAQVFADGHEFHFRRDDAAARVVHLRDVGAGPGAARRAAQVEAHGRQLRVGQAFLAVVAGRAGQQLGVAALFDPGAAQLGQAAADIDPGFGVGIGAAAIVDRQRRVLLAAEHGGRVGLFDLAERHADVGPRAGLVHLAGFGQRRDGGRVHFSGGGQEFGIGVHGKLQANGWSRSGRNLRRANGGGNTAPSIGIIRTGTKGLSQHVSAWKPGRVPLHESEV